MFDPKLSIVPDDNNIYMFGTTRTCSQYSLSGNIIISIPPLERKQLRIHSLSVTFQGAAQYSDSQSRLSNYRLAHCSDQIVKRTNAPHVFENDSNEFINVSVFFDLRLNGWLPPSISLPSSRTSYGLFAKMECTIEPIEHSKRSSLLWPLNNTIKKLTVLAPESEIYITRHRNQHQRSRVHNIRSQCPTHDIKDFKPVRIGIKTPMWYFTDDDDLKLDIFTGLVNDDSDESTEARLESLQLGCVEEIHYTSEPRQRYLQTYPLPQCQPPTYPLIPFNNSFPEHTLNDIASTLGISTMPTSYTRSRLVARGVGPPPATAAFATHTFGEEGVNISGKLTARIALTLPMPTKEERSSDKVNPNGCNSSPYPDCETPFVKVRHALRLILNIIRKAPGDEEWRGESIDITIPVWFSTRSSDSQIEVQAQRLALLKSKGLLPHSNLPAYSQLYTDQGAQVEDEEAPPRYNKNPEPNEETLLSGESLRRTNIPPRLELDGQTTYINYTRGINSPISPEPFIGERSSSRNLMT
ncbi:hypothetical protein E3Q23_03031 [Wallemia mellicola]|uniref:Arrestin-like N-terminal domain-containing protein n=1 Tax=Wallemia mellicola TaxID=1708541 RepID=A0A4T0LTP8_9BASI|nr:hypothetical protein E3Q24_03143 [Wallemia mellicola]TIB73309.1 hypothetical protein E3Q23_03031 [Wallemia mellicola]TIB89043.1 hypothetical protein E3Q19_03172 [Wallemia mellicola]TIC09687.1 hypothetical protein E3Q14_03216 [Wallemia mellicola]TIC10069.1 hypothetical protein E3Q15_03202 [Wallemia mellicola]